MKILLVHGRGQENENADELRARWLATLQTGCEAAGVAPPKDEDVAFPFYGSRLAALSSSAAPLVEPTGGLESVGGDGYLAFQAEVLLELQEAAGLGDEVRAELDDADVDPTGLESMGAEALVHGVLDREWVRALLRVMDERFGRTTRRLLGQVVRDVWTYLTVPGVRDEIDQLVGACLTDAPTVVVGHSLGSIVSYSVLRRRESTHPRIAVPRHVTVGSPLGIHAIRDRFRPLRMPAGVTDWFNAYDERDVVALRTLDTHTFPIEPAVRNKGDVVNPTDNHHGIVGYLCDPDVARAICG